MRTKFLLGSLKGRDHLQDLGVDGRIILKWIYVSKDVGYGLDLSGSSGWLLWIR
jgi:hypothetical protein